LRIKRPQDQIQLGAPQTAGKLRAVGGCFFSAFQSEVLFFGFFIISHNQIPQRFLMIQEALCGIFYY